eukprot:279204_1
MDPRYEADLLCSGFMRSIINSIKLNISDDIINLCKQFYGDGLRIISAKLKDITISTMQQPLTLTLETYGHASLVRNFELILYKEPGYIKIQLSKTKNYDAWKIRILLVYFEIYCLETYIEYKGVRQLKSRSKNIWMLPLPMYNKYEQLTFKFHVNIIKYDYVAYGSHYSQCQGPRWCMYAHPRWCMCNSYETRMGIEREKYTQYLSKINKTFEYQWIINKKRLKYFKNNLSDKYMYSDLFGDHEYKNRFCYLYLIKTPTRNKEIKLRLKIFKLKKGIKLITFKYSLIIDFGYKTIEYNGLRYDLGIKHPYISYGKSYEQLYPSQYCQYWNQLETNFNHLTSITIKMEIQ